MRSGYKITLGVLTMMILFTITVGTSYSYYSVSDKQTGTNNLATTCFDITFEDSNYISMNSAGKYAYPMSEATALTKTPYTFTVTNTCTAENAGTNKIKYDISLNSLVGVQSDLAPYVKFRLNRTLPSVVNGTSSSLTGKEDAALNAAVKTQENIDTSYNLSKGNVIGPGESATFNLYLWIDENACIGNACQTTVMNKSFTGRVLLYAYM